MLSVFVSPTFLYFYFSEYHTYHSRDFQRTGKSKMPEKSSTGHGKERYYKGSAHSPIYISSLYRAPSPPHVARSLTPQQQQQSLLPQQYHHHSQPSHTHSLYEEEYFATEVWHQEDLLSSLIIVNAVDIFTVITRHQWLPHCHFRCCYSCLVSVASQWFPLVFEGSPVGLLTTLAVQSWNGKPELLVLFIPASVVVYPKYWFCVSSFQKIEPSQDHPLQRPHNKKYVNTYYHGEIIALYNVIKCLEKTGRVIDEFGYGASVIVLYETFTLHHSMATEQSFNLWSLFDDCQKPWAES